MAEVWQAVHVGSQIPVAFKVITKAAARDPLFLKVFKNEVHSVARLDHPGVIMVFDYGEIPIEAERSSEKRLTAGSPYLAMELASWGSLDRLKRTLEWPDLCRILLGLLDALAHAHARGVLHRDLKPGNVLVSTASDLRPGIKLTDFGIAHALHVDEDSKASHEGVAGGTPLFMSPEQFVGEWREFGPWTDLYAVGCLAFFFATGSPPFSADNTMALGVQHIRKPPPPLLSPEPVPAGFESWVARLLAKDPTERFQRAADAAWALARMRDENPIGRRGTPAPNTIIPETPEAPTTLPWMVDEKLFENVTPSREPLQIDPQVRLMEREIPPLPFSWKTPPRPKIDPRMIGAGLGLYGIRKIPLVNRDSERDVLWGRLSSVRDSGEAELVLLSGPAGIGKSRLVEWVCERADEVGGATVMRAFFGPMRSPPLAIAQMLIRQLRVQDLPPLEVRDRIQRFLRLRGIVDDYEYNALTELVTKRPERHNTSTSAMAHFTTAIERHNLVHRFVAMLAEERPVIVWFDDVQYGADALIYARHFLDSRKDDPCRVLFLLTVRDDLLAERPMEAELLEEVMSRPGVTRVSVPALAQADQQILIHELLGLQANLATEVAVRTAGNPLFAAQLVDDWVHRGVLELDRNGFRLKEGEEAELPENLREIWLHRIEDLLEGEPAEAIVALELAAVLGGEIDREEWELACEHYGITVPPNLLASMLDHRLAYTVGKRWAFAHNMLRESLEQHAHERLRYAAHHRLCGAMLEARHGTEHPDHAERIGRHLLEGESFSEALGPLFTAVNARWRASDYAQAQLLLDDLERTLASVAMDNADPRWSECWLLRARIAASQGRYRDAITWSERARDHGRYFDLQAPLARALRERGIVAQILGDTAEANRLLAEAELLFQQIGDRAGRALCHLAIADAYFVAGQLALATTRYQEAQKGFRESGDTVGLAASLHGLGLVARWLGRHQDARSILERELELAESTNNRHAFARAKAALGDLSRDRGNLAPAESAYRQAVQILETIGSSDRMLVQIDLGLLLLEAGDIAQARRELHEVKPLLEQIDEPLKALRLRMALAADAASHEQWQDFAEQVERARELIDATQIVDGVLARAAELAAELAQKCGRRDHAHAAITIARAQWAVLKR